MLLKKGVRVGLAIQQRSLTTLANEKLANNVQFVAEPYKGPSYEEVLRIREKNIFPAVTAHYKKPLLIHNGKMQYLFDHTGRRYLDMFAGIVTVSVGHCHPKVNAALKQQLDELWHTTNIYMHPKIHEYSEALAAKFPGNLKVAYFVNSGSEANDLAMMLARLYTGNFDILTLQNAYHGASPYTTGLTAHATWRPNIPGVSNGIQYAMNPDPYQGLWGGKNCRDSPIQTTRDCSCGPNECNAAENYYKQMENVFKYSLPVGKVAGFFLESIQGVGGSVQYPKGFVKRAAELVRANGGLFISDEVQTGFGRTGDHYWGFEGHDIMPDIVTMAKGIGNGFPMGAVVTTPEIAKSLSNAYHFNTFGGNPMACAVGKTVLEVIDEEGLQENCKEVGTYFLQGLAKLRDIYDIVGDVRGKGLMIGVEFVKSKESREPLSALQFNEIWEMCKDLGVLFGKGGINGNVMRIKPPMCVTKDDVDLALEVLNKSIKAYLKAKRQP